MESLPNNAFGEVGLVACCECGTGIAPNPANMCVACLRAKVDITEGIPRQSNLQHCKFCERYLVPPGQWLPGALESKELLAICLRRVKPQLTSVRLVDAAFIWTEPHSKRVKIKLTVQKEVFVNAVLQQSFVIEFVVMGLVCEACHRSQAKDYWRACIQIRQNCEFKKTLFYLEQLLLKHDAAALATSVKPVPTGLDFFYAKHQDARKLVEFISAMLPCKHTYSQQLISQDIRNNTYDYKHTFLVEICPITKDALICLSKRSAQSFGNMSQVVLCLRVTNAITLIDPATLQMVEVNSLGYFKDPFEIFIGPRSLVEFYVMEKEPIDLHRGKGHGHVSTKHELSHLWVCRGSEVGVPDAQVFSVHTHLGKYLQVGDSALGYDLANTNINSPLFDAMPESDRPDVVLVRKKYDRALRHRKRNWKLKRLLNLGETASVENEFMNFVEDLEEDEALRERVNLYRDPTKQRRLDTVSELDDEDLPDGTRLTELMDELQITEDVEMQ